MWLHGDDNLRSVTYSLGHTNTGIPDGEGLVLLVWDDVDAQVLARVKFAGVRERLISNFVKRIRRVGDDLSQEDFLVRVDCVDDQGKQLRDLGLEFEL